VTGAEKGGNLKSSSQEKVTHQDKTIVIEPADPQIVYVPEYDPWLVYGEPIGSGPGWYSYPGLSLPVRGSRLASAMESASLAASLGMAQLGTIGNHHGIIFNHNT